MISIIVAMTKNRAIGKNNKILYKIPADFRRMKKLTMGHPIIMGRKTFESIGQVLKGRTNIIISRNPKYKIKGTLLADSLEKAIKEAKASEGSEEIFIFGGVSIYQESLEKNIIDKMYITLIDEKIDGDVFFPDFDKEEWLLKKDLKRVTKVNDKEIVYFFQEFIRACSRSREKVVG